MGRVVEFLIVAALVVMALYYFAQAEPHKGMSFLMAAALVLLCEEVWRLRADVDRLKGVRRVDRR